MDGHGPPDWDNDPAAIEYIKHRDATCNKDKPDPLPRLENGEIDFVKIESSWDYFHNYKSKYKLEVREFDFRACDKQTMPWIEFQKAV